MTKALQQEEKIRPSDGKFLFRRLDAIGRRNRNDSVAS
jgi:hypothetical protein